MRRNRRSAITRHQSRASTGSPATGSTELGKPRPPHRAIVRATRHGVKRWPVGAGASFQAGGTSWIVVTRRTAPCCVSPERLSRVASAQRHTAFDRRSGLEQATCWARLSVEPVLVVSLGRTSRVDRLDPSASAALMVGSGHITADWPPKVPAEPAADGLKHPHGALPLAASDPRDPSPSFSVDQHHESAHGSNVLRRSQSASGTGVLLTHPPRFAAGPIRTGAPWRADPERARIAREGDCGRRSSTPCADTRPLPSYADHSPPRGTAPRHVAPSNRSR